MTGRTTAIVLAAGLGRRFGGRKLAARLEGKPVLQHVLDALAAAGIDDPIVVVGEDGPALERVIGWRAARRVRNQAPERGLATSLRIGWAAAAGSTPALAAVLIVLADQPRLRPETVRAVLAEPPDPARPVVVARHADGARNPVRVEAAAFDLVAEAVGDRGLGPLLDARPSLVRTLAIAGSNPDVDVPGDLVRLIADGWAERVRANAAQVDRFREVPDGHDFYAPISRTFEADPDRQGDAVLDTLIAIARPEETWLDIGAGAGRYAVPVARRVRTVIALDPSPAMLAATRSALEAHGILNVQVVAGRWPPDAALRDSLGADPVADVVLIAHVGYDVERILPFLDAMEAAARRRCVAVLMAASPATAASPFWTTVHGERRVPLPALPEFLELLEAVGRDPVLTRVAGVRRRWSDRTELLTFLRRQLWTRPGTAADRRLTTALDVALVRDPDGSVALSENPPLEIGVVSWDPGRGAPGSG